MKAYIRKIILFNSEGNKREVDLTDGLNVITGDSKTGKSALIEIVDYCLFSSRSSIPKGIITDSTYLFSIIIKIEDKFIVIARPSTKSDDWRKAYFKIEITENFLSDFSFKYFDNLVLRNIKDDIQSDVEKHLGLAVLDTTEDIDSGKKVGKASMRNFVSLLFQHQNLIANKHALFYRFDDFKKRQKTINEIPIFLGWVDGEYYNLIKELEEKERKLKIEKKMIEQIELNKEKLKLKLSNLIENYYSMIGLKLDNNLSFKEIKNIGQNLPQMPETAYSSTELQINISDLKKQREEKQNNLSEIVEELNKLEDTGKYAFDYASKIKQIESTIEIDDEKEIKCPICHNRVENIEETLNIIKNSKNKLMDDLKKVGTYKDDNSEQILYLRKNRDILKEEIRSLTAKINQLEEQNNQFKEKRQLRDQVMVFKGTIETTINQILDENYLARNSIDIEELKNQIEDLKKKIEGYNLKTKYEQANTFLHNRMNEICAKLDFEDELKPVNLNFDLKDFSFYHSKDREKINLSEMGSGANWLACHLSLFLALLDLVCSEKKSCIPSFLFIDQPSQVYFPKEFSKTEDNYDENIKQVEIIFNVLLEEIQSIKERCQYFPQVVVMEHADNLKLKNANFNDYVRKRWSKNGEKLI